MAAKHRVNAVLYRLTGHHLADGAPGALREQLKTARAELRQERTLRLKLANALEANARSLSRLQPPKPPARKGDGFPRDYDDKAKDVIRLARPYTMTNNEKLYGLIQATRYIVRNKIPGDIVECGVWRGGSMHAAARTLLECGDTDRHLYLFDTFEGMSEPSSHDVRWDGQTASELLDKKDKSTLVWAVASLDDVRAGFQQVPYPPEKLHYVVGRVEHTVPTELPAQISILRLDTDWYESTKHELAHAFSRLSPGGVLIIDDYAHWTGSKKATDEFLAALNEPFLLHRMADGRIGIRQPASR